MPSHRKGELQKQSKEGQCSAGSTVEVQGSNEGDTSVETRGEWPAR